MCMSHKVFLNVCVYMCLLTVMGRMQIVLSNQLEEKLRKKAAEKKGMKKGSISEAVSEAVEKWIKDN